MKKSIWTKIIEERRERLKNKTLYIEESEKMKIIKGGE